MAISCGSCGIVFLESDLVFLTCCSHTFHQKCLFNQLYRNNCPQCYVMCTEFNVQRLYLSFTEETPKNSAISELLIQVDRIKSDISAQQRSFEIHRQLLLSWIEYENCFPIYSKMMKTDHEKKLSELTYLKEQKNNIEKRLNEMKVLDMLQTVLSGTSIDVDEMLQTKIPTEILATMVVLLRREVKAVDDEQKYYRMALRDCQQETKELYSNQSTFLDQIETLKDKKQKTHKD